MQTSVIEYTRFYGLTEDHLEQDPLRSLSDTLSLSEGPAVEDDPDLASLIRAHYKVPIERLQVNIETLAFLKASIQTPVDDGSDARGSPLMDIRRSRQSKLEPPLLRRDPEYELRAFRQRLEPDLMNENIPLESIDEEAGEGIAWPSIDHRRLQELWHQIRTEKLSIPLEGLNYLRSCIEAPPAVECPSGRLRENEDWRSRQVSLYVRFLPQRLPTTTCSGPECAQSRLFYFHCRLRAHPMCHRQTLPMLSHGPMPRVLYERS